MEQQENEDRAKKLKYAGNPYQLGGTRHYRLAGGVRDGVRCIDVHTGSGFDYTIVPDRGMDISLASYKGRNLTYLTDAAEAHPAYYDPEGTEWLRTFSGGLLTTCGPTYLGPPCEDEGEKLGLHGRISAIPARDVCDLSDPETGIIRITGSLHDIRPFGTKVAVKREIVSEIGTPAVVVTDTVTNKGKDPVPLCLLYHINFGYPFLTEQADFCVPSAQCAGYDDYTRKRMKERFHMHSPSAELSERNYMHTFRGGPVTMGIWNKRIDMGLAVTVTFDSGALPYVTQWMLENPIDYVAALEPANVPCLSRSELRSLRLLPQLGPGESRTFSVTIGILEGNTRIAEHLTVPAENGD